MMGMDQDDILLAPWTTIKYRVTGTSVANVNQSATSSSGSEHRPRLIHSTRFTQMLRTTSIPCPPRPRPPILLFRCGSPTLTRSSRRLDRAEQSPAAIQQITQLLRERHRIRLDEPDDFNVRDMTEMTKALSSTATMMTKLLLAVALISLVVGGVGIMNIMLVSVTERTREIGLRMAVGARAGNILQQFLTESVVLCFCGGVAGILLGRGISYLVTDVATLAHGAVPGRDTGRLRRFGHCRHHFWLLPRVEGFTAGSRSSRCGMNDRNRNAAPKAQEGRPRGATLQARGQCSRKTKRLGAICIPGIWLLALAGCAVGPDYRPPEPHVP